MLFQALKELGLIDEIGKGVGSIIGNASEDTKLTVAVLLILWVSAFASSFIDNIPYTTAMVSDYLYCNGLIDWLILWCFNDISAISWWSILLEEETGVPGGNHRPAASHWQTLSHNVVHLALSVMGTILQYCSLYITTN